MITRFLLISAFALAFQGITAQVITPSSVAEFNKHHKGDKPMITMYSASWCGPCKQTKPHFHAAEKACSDIVFCLVDTDNKALASITKSIRSVPTFIFSHKGKQMDRFSGGRTRKQLDTAINRFRTKVKATK